MRRLAILGASGHGKVVADAALAAGWEAVEFFDDAWPVLDVLEKWPVRGDTRALLAADPGITSVIVAIGANRVRLRKLDELAAAGLSIATVLHPAAVVSRFAELGVGGVVCAGAVVNAFARLGRGCIVNTGASIDHDCAVAAGVHVSPGARLGGGVRVGEATWIGIGACVTHEVSIGSDVIVGAGAAVVGNIESGLTVRGVPAKAT